MATNRSIKILAAAALALVILAVLFVTRRDDSPGTALTGDSVPPPESAVERAGAPGAATPAAPGSAATPGPRMRIPRFTTTGAVTADAGAVTAPVGTRLAKGGDIANRFKDSPARWKELQSRSRELLDQVSERAERCLARWNVVDPSLKQGVMLAVEIDAQGLQDVWFEDRADMPSGPLECFSDAVYQIDWSSVAGLAEQPVKLTFKAKYESDGG